METPFQMTEVLPLLDLEPNPKQAGDTSRDYRCPFCNDKGYHLNINFARNVYSCVLCKSGGGVLKLYAAVQMGELQYTKEVGKRANRELRERINGLDKDESPKTRPNLPKIQIPQPSFHPIHPAEDDVLHQTYSMLLRLPLFQLSAEHMQKLFMRGMSCRDILMNGYRTIPTEAKLKAEVSADEESEMGKIPEKILSQLHCRKHVVCAGIKVAQKLIQAGCCLDGVPGFFKVNGHWCFRMIPGMMIPVVSAHGKIVGLTVRRDFGKVRYMVLSGKGFEGGVTENINRVHYTQKPQGDTIYLTEGALKAGVIDSLTNHQFPIMATPGVSASTTLRSQLPMLRELGIKTIVNALDMDKLTNGNVRNALVRMNRLLDAEGFTVQNLCWDTHYAKELRQKLMEIAKEHHQKIPENLPENVFSAVGILAEILDNANIPHLVQYDADGGKHGQFWCQETKGYDDYLLQKQKNRIGL